jgi:LPXTG-motif cell wall-anchored protein
MVAVGVLAFAVFAASCDSGSSDSDKSESTSPTSGSTATQASATPVGPEAAIAAYLDSQNIKYAGDCATAKLPRDKGKWCSTLQSGADDNDQKVYALGPVGGEPQTIITLNRHGQAELTPGDQVGVENGNVGQPQQLTHEQLLADAFITGNLLLDQQAGIGNGLTDVPGTTETPPATTTPGGGGTGGSTPPTVVEGEPPAGEPGPYPPEGTVVVDNPTTTVGGEVTFHGSGCSANEPLEVLFDGKQIGTITSGPDGTFAGSIKIPVGTAPGAHTLTVRGKVCVLNTTIFVEGELAFTGSSNHTSTYVLGGIAAVIIGSILVVGSRRRRRTLGRPRTPPSTA